MIRSCAYCFAVFEDSYWSYADLKEFCLCSICCEEILRNQEQDKRINKIKHKLHCGEKQFFRGGSILKNLTSRPEKYLTGEEILSIFNSYGIEPRQLKILLLSHGCDGDYDEFVRLLEEQHERSKNMR